MQEYWVNVYKYTVKCVYITAKRATREECIERAIEKPIYRIHVKMKPVKRHLNNDKPIFKYEDLIHEKWMEL